MIIPKLNKNKGFTLIELSIALIVIALIITAIYKSKDLFEVSKLNAIATQMNGLATATSVFVTKYEAYPGDMKDAKEYWSSKVRNGDGNGYVIYSYLETFNAFIMLKEAGIYQKTTNEDEDYNGGAIAGNHLPKCQKFAGCMLAIALVGGANASSLEKPVKNGIITSGKTSSIEPGFNNGVFKPRQAQFIDQKMDDGIDNTGNVRAYTTDICDSSVSDYSNCGSAPLDSNGSKMNIFKILD